ncbi:MAG: DUF4402 domain-containing protein [Bacteroidota bacterium]|nr:DUF4402 domain-containing protein [Bacteroidota bacterium]
MTKKRTFRTRSLYRSFRLPAMFILFVLAESVKGQELPPRPVVVTANPAQPLSFGAFSPGASGGTITVTAAGTRSSSGSVVLLSLGYVYNPAMFYVRANPGTVLSVLATPPVTLTGSGGGTITLQTSGTLPASPFVTTLPWPQQTTLLVGGILTVGNIASNPPGTYTGTLTVTLVRE